MLPLKLVRSLMLGETMMNHNPHILKQKPHTHHHHHHHHQSYDNDHNTNEPKIRSKKKPALLFLPTKEIITNTYRLATIARDLGIDFYPTPSLSHIIFSNSSSSSSSSPSTSTPTPSSCSLLNDAVPIPFPSIATSSLTHLRNFVTLFPRAFKIVLFNSDEHPDADGVCGGGLSNWDCCSFSLYSRVTGVRVDTMEGFCRVLAGKGWSFFKTKKNPSGDQQCGGGGDVFLFRKVDVNRVRVGSPDGACRVRELRLPHLDFENAPLRILQYILLMTDDIFCLVDGEGSEVVERIFHRESNEKSLNDISKSDTLLLLCNSFLKKPKPYKNGRLVQPEPDKLVIVHCVYTWFDKLQISILES